MPGSEKCLISIVYNLSDEPVPLGGENPVGPIHYRGMIYRQIGYSTYSSNVFLVYISARFGPFVYILKGGIAKNNIISIIVCRISLSFHRAELELFLDTFQIHRYRRAIMYLVYVSWST